MSTPARTATQPGSCDARLRPPRRPDRGLPFTHQLELGSAGGRRARDHDDPRADGPTRSPSRSAGIPGCSLPGVARADGSSTCRIDEVASTIAAPDGERSAATAERARSATARSTPKRRRGGCALRDRRGWARDRGRAGRRIRLAQVFAPDALTWLPRADDGAGRRALHRRGPELANGPARGRYVPRARHLKTGFSLRVQDDVGVGPAPRRRWATSARRSCASTSARRSSSCSRAWRPTDLLRHVLLVALRGGLPAHSMDPAVIFRYDEAHRRVRAAGAFGLDLDRFATRTSPWSAPIARQALVGGPRDRDGLRRGRARGARGFPASRRVDARRVPLSAGGAGAA